MKPEIRVGQEWEKAHNDGPSSRPTRVRVLGVTCRGKHLRVGTVTPDGRVIRERDLLGSALTNTPGGYMLVKDVGETTPRTSPDVTNALASLLSDDEVTT